MSGCKEKKCQKCGKKKFVCKQFSTCLQAEPGQQFTVLQGETKMINVNFIDQTQMSSGPLVIPKNGNYKFVGQLNLSCTGMPPEVDIAFLTLSLYKNFGTVTQKIIGIVDGITKTIPDDVFPTKLSLFILGCGLNLEKGDTVAMIIEAFVGGIGINCTIDFGTFLQGDQFN